MGVVIGTAIGGITTTLRMHDVLRDEGPRWVSAYFLPNIIPDAPAGHVAITCGARGYNLAPVGACATGGQAVGEALRAVRDGLVDVVIAGGAEAAINPLVLSGFVQMRALATNDDPGRACRPFDRERSGFVCSEGAAMLIIESEEHALARGARPLATLMGYGCNADAHDMAAPHPDSSGLIEAIELALRNADISPADIDYVNPHGTGTPLGDRLEARALHHVFPQGVPATSGVKGSVGHMMAAAGAFEAVAATQSVRSGVIAPTLNHDNPDPALELELVAGTPLSRRVRTALSTSMGLAGHNTAILVGEYGSN
jgi:3-oxoacyl-(acyl-carrier-protein) synthase